MRLLRTSPGCAAALPALMLAAALSMQGAALAGGKEGKEGRPAGPPGFSHEGGFFTPPLRLEIVPAEPGAEVRFTTDCSDPGPDSPLYAGPITIDRTACVRARSFQPGKAPGRIGTVTLVAGRQPNMPLLCLATDPKNLYDSNTGLFKRVGDRGEEWERPVHAAFYEPSGRMAFQADAGIRLAGGVSRNFRKKSFRIYFRSKYGPARLKYPMFGDGGVGEFECIRVRASGNDQMTAESRWTLLRDAVNNELYKKAGGCSTDVRFSLVVLNGDMQGLYDLREHCNADFLRDKFGTKNPDLLKVSIYLPGEAHCAVKDGDRAAWDAVESFFRDCDLSRVDDFATAVEMIDVEDFINEHSVRFYGADWDWPQNNRYFFRDRSPGSRFRFVIWDSEWTFDLNGSCSAARDIVSDYLGNPDGLRSRHAFMFRKMLGSPAFRAWFLTRTADLLNTVLSSENVAAEVRRLAREAAPGIPFEVDRWGGSARQWMENVEVLMRFAKDRPAHFRNHLLASFPEAKGLWTLRIEPPDSGVGEVRVNTLRLLPKDLPWAGVYFAGVDVAIQAVCPAGYRFAGWSPAAFGLGRLLVLDGKGGAKSFILPRESGWDYYSGGGRPDQGWELGVGSHDAWLQGKAPLGYGEGDEATALSFGPDAGSKIPAHYFRKVVDLQEDPTGDCVLELVADDGAVVFVNGAEALRVNMPGGRIGHETPAAGVVGGAEEKAWQRHTLPRGMLKKGRNAIAAEVHQASPASSDLRFDLSLSFEEPAIVKPVFEKADD